MRTVQVLLPNADLAKVMGAMRICLDRRRVQPALFRYDDIGGRQLLMELAFPDESKAAAFAAAFGALQSIETVPRWHLRHTAAATGRSSRRVRPPILAA